MAFLGLFCQGCFPRGITASSLDVRQEARKARVRCLASVTVCDWRRQTQLRAQPCQSNQKCVSRPYEVERGFPHSRLPDPSAGTRVQHRVIQRRTNPPFEALLQLLSSSRSAERANSCVILSSSRSAESSSSERTTNLFPLSRCASTIHIVRPSESTAETQPQLQPDLLLSRSPSRRSGSLSEAQFSWGEGGCQCRGSFGSPSLMGEVPIGLHLFAEGVCPEPLR